MNAPVKPRPGISADIRIPSATGDAGAGIRAGASAGSGGAPANELSASPLIPGEQFAVQAEPAPEPAADDDDQGDYGNQVPVNEIHLDGPSGAVGAVEVDGAEEAAPTAGVAPVAGAGATPALAAGAEPPTTAGEAEVAGEADGPAELSYDFAKRHKIFVEQNEIIYSSDTDPWSLFEAQRFLYASGQKPVFIKVDGEELTKRLGGKYSKDDVVSSSISQSMEDIDLSQLAASIPVAEDLLSSNAENSPSIRLINALLTKAIQVNASDIHFETREERFCVRFRIDGILRDILQPQRELAPLLLSRLKIMAQLDIAEKRVPQDGRISLNLGSRRIDVRVSSLPTQNAERIVLRMLYKDSALLSLGSIGMHEEDLVRFRPLLDRPNGLILVTGPTGSGKTTTLYAALNYIKDEKSNLLTIEDPIEYELDGISQTQVNVKSGMTFARGLRAMLRQDPDVIMVGEIRDIETAQIAIQASLTGHMVLSTLHTNTAISSLTRMTDMGIEPYLLGSSLIGVIAQRLVRRLCQDCMLEHPVSESERLVLQRYQADKVPEKLYAPVGCAKCDQQGYSGRTGVYELICIDEEIQELMEKNAPESQLSKVARKNSKGLFENGLPLIFDGQTTLSELLRISQE